MEAKLQEKPKKSYKKNPDRVSKMNFNWAGASMAQFEARYNKLLIWAKDRGLKTHKWRILQFYCLDFRNWKKQLQGDNVVAWKQKLEYMQNKIQEGNLMILDEIFNSGNEVAIARIMEKESSNIFESDEEANKQTINIIANSNFAIAENAKIAEPLELEVD